MSDWTDQKFTTDGLRAWADSIEGKDLIEAPLPSVRTMLDTVANNLRLAAGRIDELESLVQ